MTKWTIPDMDPILAQTLQREEDANRAAFNHLRRIEQLEAGIIAALRERDENMRPILRAALHGEG